MKMVDEFKQFIMRGNVMDMAVGVIVGSAFTSIVNSLVNDIIMPVITLLTGKINFTDLMLSLDGNTYKTLADAQAAGASVIAYGNFIQTVVDFALIAVCIFVFVKLITKLRKKPEPEAPKEPARLCPFCKSEIHKEATRCPHCTSELK